MRPNEWMNEILRIPWCFIVPRTPFLQYLRNAWRKDRQTDKASYRFIQGPIFLLIPVYPSLFSLSTFLFIPYPNFPAPFSPSPSPTTIHCFVWKFLSFSPVYHLHVVPFPFLLPGCFHSNFLIFACQLLKELCQAVFVPIVWLYQGQDTIEP